MSEAVSSMAGAEFSGAVDIREDGLQGMVTLRGDLGDAKIAGAVKAAVGLAMPKARQIKQGKNGGVAWMSPDEVLLLCDHAGADALVAKLDRALEGVHHLAVNVSDARAMFTLTGTGVREVIAKGAPADLSPAGLPIGEIRRSRIGQIAAAFWLSEAETMHVVCFRSVGAHMFRWLENAAAADTLPGVL
ncbi:MAG: sarcosine oxidase subunit gamma [Rhodobacteraceae bacterium]|nr:sarcosine oxidase subunit gamma [Paracoccaceae bacterium]